MDQAFDITALQDWRRERDSFFKAHYSSPIPEEHLATFTGLAYFEPDPELVLIGSFAAKADRIEITSSTGGVTPYHVAGLADLAVGSDRRQLLTLHGDEEELFIPFRDATCGIESYAGGRYAPAETTGDGVVVVDFNRAVNPYCVYDEEFSCPLPPVENWFSIAIRAGEKAYRPPTNH